MNDDVTRLRRWLQRARPPRRALLVALLTGYVASTANVALVAGAVGLLVESARRPGLRAVAVVLVVIELFAFLRSPLRFTERVSAHRLGFAATSSWRAWLARAIGRLDVARWRAFASGDLLERALNDTDELQALWLRFFVPIVTTLLSALTLDVVVVLLAPRPHWWPVALLLAIVISAAGAALGLLALREVRLDRQLRVARAAYRAEVVELAAVAPELRLLAKGAYAARRSERRARDLGDAELARDRARLPSQVVVVAAALGAVAALFTHPNSSPTWLAVVAVAALATYELLDAVRLSLQSAVTVIGGGERLELFESETKAASAVWPPRPVLTLANLDVREGPRALVLDASLRVAAGERVALIGVSGTGKSALLRVVANLDRPDAGRVYVDEVELATIDDLDLRRHLVYVPSEPGLTRGYALDVVRLGRDCERDVFGDLASLGIVADATTRWEELSRGERKRVAIVRALATAPDVVVLDEPTAGLGEDDIEKVLTLLKDSRATVVAATHDSRVRAWCDRVVELRDERLSV